MVKALSRLSLFIEFFRFEDETSAHLTYGSRGFEGISSANLFGVED